MNELNPNLIPAGSPLAIMLGNQQYSQLQGQPPAMPQAPPAAFQSNPQPPRPLQGAPSPPPPPPPHPAAPPGAPPAQSAPAQAQNQEEDLLQRAYQRSDALQAAMGERMGLYQQGASALKDLLAQTANTLSQTPVEPSMAERYGRLAAAMGSPTRTGTFGERMGNVGGASAQVLEQAREAELAKQQLMAKYGIQAGELGMQIPMAGLQQLTSMLNSNDARLTSLAIAKGRQNPIGATIIMGANGQPQVNDAAVQAKGQVAGIEAAARMHAQMAGITGPAQDQMNLMAQQIAAYKRPMPTLNTRTPYGIAYANALNAAVTEYNPNYDTTGYGSKVKAVNSFAGGNDGKMLDSINTATQHVSQLIPLAAAMDNGDIRLINQARAAYMTATGRAAPTNAALVQNIAAEEINKIAVGGPGAEEDRELMRAGLDVRNASPGQAAGSIDNALGLMAGRANSMRNRYKAATHLGDADFEAYLLPETRQALSTHSVAPHTTAEITNPTTHVGAGQSVTRAQVHDYATKHGLTDEQAATHVTQSGFKIAD